MTGRKRRMWGLASSLFAKAHIPRLALRRLSLRGIPIRKNSHASRALWLAAHQSS
jgi:hypothetical protein